MFCKNCGTELAANATECSNCNTRTTPVKFCQKCGESMPGDQTICGACNTRSSIKSSPLQWLSLGLSFIAFIFLGPLGGDYYLREVNIFDLLVIPISLAALVSVFLFRGHIVLKIISAIIAGFLLIGSIGWALQ